MAKRTVLSVLAGLLALVALWAWRISREPAPVVTLPAPAAAVAVAIQPPVPPPARPEIPPPAPEAAATPRPDPRTAGSPLAAELNAPGGSPERDVQALHEMLRQYLRLLHSRRSLPIGNDADLLRVLTGHNPMKLTFLPSTHPAVGADGRLRDRWGRPYFVHPRGDSAYEIRSAGPDRKLFTDDDLVANPAPVASAPEESETAPAAER